jgi:hypothetical protein
MFLTSILGSAAAISDLAVKIVLPQAGGLIAKGAGMLGTFASDAVTRAGGSSVLASIAGDTAHTAVNGAFIRETLND